MKQAQRIIDRALQDMDIPRQDHYKVQIPRPYSRKLMQYMAEYIIVMIQLKMPRNGINSIENTQSKKHIKDIAETFGIDLANINPCWVEDIVDQFNEPVASVVNCKNVPLTDREYIEKLERNARVYKAGKLYPEIKADDN